MIDDLFITSGLIRKKVSLKFGGDLSLQKSLSWRLLSFHKDFFDNSSRGIFTNRRVEDAWGLFDLVSENTDNWDLDKGKIITIDYGYDCVKNFYTSNVFGELSRLYSINSHVLLEVVKSFAKHVALPKEGLIEYVKPIKYPTIMPTRIHAPNASPVLAIKAPETNDFVEAPPLPNKVQENLLTYILNKSARRKCTPYEQIEMKPEVSIIKELYEENPQEVYLCDDATKVIKGNTTRFGNPIISCAIGTPSYHGLCDIGASISVIPYILYLEIKDDIDPIEIEETCMTIQLANKEYISPLGMVRDVGVLIGKIKYHAIFFVLGCSQDSFCHIIFGRPFCTLLAQELICVKKECI
jgi:hypothetical protein